MLGAKAFWEAFRILFFFLKEFFKRTMSKDEVQKDKQSWKIWSQDSKKYGSSEQKCRSCRDLSALPLKILIWPPCMHASKNNRLSPSCFFLTPARRPAPGHIAPLTWRPKKFFRLFRDRPYISVFAKIRACSFGEGVTLPDFKQGKR